MNQIESILQLIYFFTLVSSVSIVALFLELPHKPLTFSLQEKLIFFLPSNYKRYIKFFSLRSMINTDGRKFTRDLFIRIWMMTALRALGKKVVNFQKTNLFLQYVVLWKPNLFLMVCPTSAWEHSSTWPVDNSSIFIGSKGHIRYLDFNELLPLVRTVGFHLL